MVIESSLVQNLFNHLYFSAQSLTKITFLSRGDIFVGPNRPSSKKGHGPSKILLLKPSKEKHSGAQLLREKEAAGLLQLITPGDFAMCFR